MKDKEYKENIKNLNQQVLNDIIEQVRANGTFQFAYETDNPRLNTRLRFYDGNKYPVIVTVTEAFINDDGVLEFYGADANRYTADRMHSADTATLNRGFELVQDCNTPAKFARLLDRCEGFPLVLHVIMDRNGWYDLTDEEDTPNVCWCPAEKTLILYDGKKTITRKTERYSSPETDLTDAEAWFRQADFKTLERISGLRQDDYDPSDGCQDFVDAVHRWWAAIEITFPNNGKDEKVKIWKKNA